MNHPPGSPTGSAPLAAGNNNGAHIEQRASSDFTTASQSTASTNANGPSLFATNTNNYNHALAMSSAASRPRPAEFYPSTQFYDYSDARTTGRVAQYQPCPPILMPSVFSPSARDSRYLSGHSYTSTEGSTDHRLPHVGFYSSALAPPRPAMSRYDSHDFSTDLPNHIYAPSNSLAAQHPYQLSAYTSPINESQNLIFQQQQLSSLGSYSWPTVAQDTQLAGTPQYSSRNMPQVPTIQTMPRSSYGAMSHYRPVPAYRPQPHPQQDPSSARQPIHHMAGSGSSFREDVQLSFGAPHRNMQTSEGVTFEHSVGLSPYLGQLPDITGHTQFPLVNYGGWDPESSGTQKRERLLQNHAHVADRRLSKLTHVDQERGEAAAAILVPQSYAPPVSPRTSTVASPEISEDTVTAAQLIGVHRIRKAKYKRPWGLQRILAYYFVEEAAASRGVPMPEVFEEDIMRYCNTHRSENHDRKNTFTPYFVDIRMLGNIEITAEEILTFFPDHVKWDDAIFRLTQNGWAAKDVSRYINYARGLSNLNDSRRSLISKYQQGADEIILNGNPGFVNNARRGFKTINFTAKNWVPHQRSRHPRELVDYFLVDLAQGVANFPQGDGARLLTRAINLAIIRRDTQIKLSQVNEYIRTHHLRFPHLSSLRRQRRPEAGQHPDQAALVRARAH